MTNWRTIGIIGGMGPAATIDFASRLLAASGATGDAGHPHLLIDCNPNVPDRNAARAGVGPSPGPALAAMARGLAAQGAELLAMPCNAAHGWAGDIIAATDVPFISLIDAAVAAALAARPARVGLLAVGATLDARLYHDRLADAGVTAIDGDRAVVQPLVTAIKGGDTGSAIRAAMAAEAARLVGAGAEVIIAACTEVPLVLAADAVTVPYVDATAALVAAVLAAARRA
ncbi:MAG: aspartate racemase [Alphaproteobacteria bacterium PA4]|nr:MAG: aspartate racemase [Alphaproteobacteria bacterium PA4]